MMNLKIFASILILSSVELFYIEAAAQTRNIEVSPVQQTVDGTAMGVNPGDTIFVAAGNRSELHFSNITGTDEKPVIIINRGGKVVINTEKRYAIFFSNSIHFRITGTGSNDKYGIEIASSKSQGLAISEFSSNCEADHLEIHNAGFAGIMAKTDPDCRRKDLRFFIMKNLSFHDNLIYDTASEGFYVGFSWFPIRPFRCGQDSILYAHEIHGLRIYSNDLHHTGAEAIQVGSSTRDVKIFCNSIRNYGTENALWQNNGVQIGAGTTGDFFCNYINTGTGDAISFFGGGGNRLYNNLIINAGNSAIFHNDKEAVKGRSYQIMNNTIIHPAALGITIISSHTWTNKMYNNVVVIRDTTKGILGYVDSRWYAGNNKVYKNIADAGFVNPDSGNFHLTAHSALTGSGLSVPWLDFDYDFKNRPVDMAFDIGAFRFDGPAGSVRAFPFEQEPETDMVPGEAGDNGEYIFTVNDKHISVIIYNGSGVQLDSKRIARKGRDIIIDFEGLPQGIYYVSTETANKRLPLRRIVNKI